jgi:hypothetical protein
MCAPRSSATTPIDGPRVCSSRSSAISAARAALHACVATVVRLFLTVPIAAARTQAFHENFNQSTIHDMIDALVDKSRTVDGKPTSLKDLGYDMIGIGDWAPPASRALPFVRLTAGVSVYGQTKAGKAAASVSTGRSIMPTGRPRSAPTFPTSKRWSITATAKA